jgi:hypothetical protein
MRLRVFSQVNKVEFMPDSSGISVPRAYSI